MGAGGSIGLHGVFVLRSKGDLAHWRGRGDGTVRGRESGEDGVSGRGGGGVRLLEVLVHQRESGWVHWRGRGDSIVVLVCGYDGGLGVTNYCAGGRR